MQVPPPLPGAAKAVAEPPGTCGCPGCIGELLGCLLHPSFELAPISAGFLLLGAEHTAHQQLLVPQGCPREDAECALGWS